MLLPREAVETFEILCSMNKGEENVERLAALLLDFPSLIRRADDKGLKHLNPLLRGAISTVTRLISTWNVDQLIRKHNQKPDWLLSLIESEILKPSMLVLLLVNMISGPLAPQNVAVLKLVLDQLASSLKSPEARAKLRTTLSDIEQKISVDPALKLMLRKSVETLNADLDPTSPRAEP